MYYYYVMVKMDEYQIQKKKEGRSSNDWYRGLLAGIVAGMLSFAYMIGPNETKLRDLNCDGYKDIVVEHRMGDWYGFNRGDDTFVSLEDIAKDRQLQIRFKPR